MTPDVPDAGQPYRVSYLAPARENLRVWTELAGRIHQTTSYRNALVEMSDRLQTAPAEWGEQQFDRRGMNVTQFLHYGPVLVVYYSVHVTSRDVFVQNVRLTPGSQLARAELSSS